MLALAAIAGLVLSVGAATPSFAAGAACGLRGSVVDNGTDFFVKRDRQKVYNSCTVSFKVKAKYDLFIAGANKGTGWTSCKSVGGGKTADFDFEFNMALINGQRAKGVWTTYNPSFASVRKVCRALQISSADFLAAHNAFAGPEL